MRGSLNAQADQTLCNSPPEMIAALRLTDMQLLLYAWYPTEKCWKNLEVEKSWNFRDWQKVMELCDQSGNLSLEFDRFLP